MGLSQDTGKAVKAREVHNGRCSETQQGMKWRNEVTTVVVEALVKGWRKVVKAALVLLRYVTLRNLPRCIPVKLNDKCWLIIFIQALLYKQFQAKNSSYNNQHTSDEEDGYNGDERPNDVRMASTTANKSHSWRGEHPIKDQNGYVRWNISIYFYLLQDFVSKIEIW